MESVVLDLAGHRRSRHPGTGDLGVANLRSSVYAQPGAGRSAYRRSGGKRRPRHKHDVALEATLRLQGSTLCRMPAYAAVRCRTAAGRGSDAMTP